MHQSPILEFIHYILTALLLHHKVTLEQMKNILADAYASYILGKGKVPLAFQRMSGYEMSRLGTKVRESVFWAPVMCFLFCYKFTPSQFITFPLCKKGTRLSKNLSLLLYWLAEGYFERRLKMARAALWLKMHCERMFIPCSLGFAQLFSIFQLSKDNLSCFFLQLLPETSNDQAVLVERNHFPSIESKLSSSLSNLIWEVTQTI